MNDIIINTLLEKGTSLAIALSVIYILTKKILAQYEVRIQACEIENRECRNDRKELHDKIETIQQDRINDLLKALAAHPPL